MAAGSLIPQMSWSPAPRGSTRPYWMTARAWVRGMTLARAVRPTGRALMGNSDPATNQGAKATAPMVLTYCSWVAMTLASTSETPYMATAKTTTVATNQLMPGARKLKSAPRRAARVTRTITCRPLSSVATIRLAATINGRRIGADSRSRWAPLMRSTITPIPDDMQLNGIRVPRVARATNVM